jgi:hypothetical protein
MEMNKGSLFFCQIQLTHGKNICKIIILFIFITGKNSVGTWVGDGDGLVVGSGVGRVEGRKVGLIVGIGVGARVGAGVG